METCYSSNESSFNKEQNDLNLESLANLAAFFSTDMCDNCVITLLTAWQEPGIANNSCNAGVIHLTKNVFYFSSLLFSCT